MREGKVGATELDVSAETRSFESSVRELRSIFIEGAQVRLGHIDRALARLSTDAGDPTAVRELRDGFHLLAGAGTTFGFPGVTSVAHAAELQCDEVMRGEASAASRLPPLTQAAGQLRQLVSEKA